MPSSRAQAHASSATLQAALKSGKECIVDEESASASPRKDSSSQPNTAKMSMALR